MEKSEKVGPIYQTDSKTIETFFSRLICSLRFKLRPTNEQIYTITIGTLQKKARPIEESTYTDSLDSTIGIFTQTLLMHGFTAADFSKIFIAISKTDSTSTLSPTSSLI